MARWELLSDDLARETWDEALLRLDDYTPFQSYARGEYLRAMGWEPCRWAASNDEGAIIAMMLGGLRRYPFGLGVVWAEAAPIGDLSACDESLQKAIAQTTGLKRIYCRFRSDRGRRVEDALRLSAQGWSRSWFQLTCNYSMTIDLTREESELLAGFDRNWRRNLRQAELSNLTVREWTDPSVDDIVSAYAEMQSLKGLEEQFSREELTSVLKTLKHQIIIFRGEDEQGELVSLRGWLVLGKRANDLLAATTERGREMRASYAVAWALLRHCRKLQIQACDLGGIEPIVNPGVYRFKKGTGATPIEYLGEWDWASRPWLQWFGNWAISRRRRLKVAEGKLKSPSRPNRELPAIRHSPTPVSSTVPCGTILNLIFCFQAMAFSVA